MVKFLIACCIVDKAYMVKDLFVSTLFTSLKTFFNHVSTVSLFEKLEEKILKLILNWLKVVGWVLAFFQTKNRFPPFVTLSPPITLSWGGDQLY